MNNNKRIVILNIENYFQNQKLRVYNKNLIFVIFLEKCYKIVKFVIFKRFFDCYFSQHFLFYYVISVINFTYKFCVFWYEMIYKFENTHFEKQYFWNHAIYKI